MALSRVKVWVSGEVLTASDLNTEFNSIINNTASLFSPLTAGLDCDGYSLTLDAAGVTVLTSTAAIGLSVTTGAKAGTPGATGSIANFTAHTFTDSATAGSGTATKYTGHSVAAPTLAASNTSVTTTDAATQYISGPPVAGTNQTITNALALWVDDGASRFDGAVNMFKGADIASASTINLTTATGNLVHVTGTTTITAVTLASGMMRQVIFDGALTLTHHATNNNLPGGVDITTAANDRALYWSDGTTVFCTAYHRANGGPAASALGGALSYTSDLSPSQIIGNVDDYNPTGLSAASVLRLDTDANRNITGIVGGSDGRVLYLVNVGLQNITLKHDQTSTAANRFYIEAGTDFVMGPNQGVPLIYDSTSSRWRVMAQNHNQSGSAATDYLMMLNAGGTPPHRSMTGPNFVDELGASAAEMEAGSAANRIVTPDVQQRHQSAAKGWCYSNTAGTIQASFNADSVTDSGAGQWVVVWTTDFSSAAYCAIPGMQYGSGGLSVMINNTAGMAAGSTPVLVQNSASTPTDPNFFSLVAYGDQL